MSGVTITPGGDFSADRDGVRYFITVKARNKYRQGTRSLNGAYNIFPTKVRKFAQQCGAVPAWLTIQVDTELRSYSAYFGTIDSLCNPSAVGVPMTPSTVAGYECLAKDRFDGLIVPELSNQLAVTRASALKASIVSRPAQEKKPMSANFQDHYSYTDEERRPLLSRIRREIRQLDNRLIERVTAGQRIAYNKQDRKVFLEVKVQRHAIFLHMVDVVDPEQITTMIPANHGWRQLARRVKVQTNDELERVLPLIRTAWLRG